MKLLAWNLAHRTKASSIKPGFFEAIEKLEPDLLTLNEYVHGTSRWEMLESLENLGLKHVLVSDRVGNNNQVLVACRYPLLPGQLRGPSSENGAAESNFLHVLIPEADLEVVGVRVPSYKGSELLSYWASLQGIMRGVRSRNVLFIGDLNTDPDSKKRSTSGHLRTLRDEGWAVPAPSGEWSFVGGTRIDHSVASPSVRIVSSQYIAEIGPITLASKDNSVRISDHAALLVEVSRGASAV